MDSRVHAYCERLVALISDDPAHKEIYAEDLVALGAEEVDATWTIPAITKHVRDAPFGLSLSPVRRKK